MLQITPQMRVLVAIDPIDGRKGIDSLARLCRDNLGQDPFSGCVFVFRTRNATTIKVLIYDGSGFWMAQKRLSQGRFSRWPSGTGAASLEAFQAQLLLAAGDPSAAGAPVWRSVRSDATSLSSPSTTPEPKCPGSSTATSPRAKPQVDQHAAAAV